VLAAKLWRIVNNLTQAVHWITQRSACQMIRIERRDCHEGAYLRPLALSHQPQRNRCALQASQDPSFDTSC
jgi:hypothetical protein